MPEKIRPTITPEASSPHDREDALAGEIAKDWEEAEEAQEALFRKINKAIRDGNMEEMARLSAEYTESSARVKMLLESLGKKESETYKLLLDDMPRDES